ncbi:MAG: hypothetical protein WCO90_04040 [Planctomycetota bacterium]
MARTSSASQITVSVGPDFRHLMRSLNTLPKTVQNEIRDKAQDISKILARDLIGNAHLAPTPTAALVAKSIRTPRDRLVRVDIGGPLQVGHAYKPRTGGRKARASAGSLMWGSEHGSRAGKDRRGRTYSNRFHAPHNPKGYWLIPGIAEMAPSAAKEWTHLVTTVLGREGLR